MWYKGAVNPRTDGWGYQGGCWTCGKVGHKTSECTVRLQEVEGEKESVEVGERFVEEDALEVEARCVSPWLCGQVLRGVRSGRG